jgi:hypothetical protein
MKRSEWAERILEAWNGDPCPRCGREGRCYHVNDDGDVCCYCGSCDKEWAAATESVPLAFDPEDEDDDLPF